MDSATLIQQIVEVCIIPLLGVLTAYIVKFVQSKSAQLQATTENEIADKYISLLSDTITKCVIATNQTYVDTLKKQNAFTKEAQEEAFKKTLASVEAVLSGDAKTYIQETFGDLETYLTTQIEAAVNQNKTEVTTE